MRWIFRTALLASCATCAAFGCILGAKFIADGNHSLWFVDWQTYANAWTRVANGGHLYSSAQLGGTYSLPNVVAEGYAYPPPSILVFAPFASWPIGFVTWTVLNVGAYLGALWAIMSRSWPKWRVEAFSLTLLGLAMFEPFREAVGTGNVSLLISAGFGWSVIAGPKVAAPIGVFAGILKLTPGSLALVGLRANWRQLFAWSCLALAWVLVSLPLTGSDAWRDYLTALGNAVPRCYPGNLGVGCLLPDLPFLRYAALVAAAVVAASTVLASRQFVGVTLAAVAYVVGSAAGDLHVHVWTVVFILAMAGLGSIWMTRTSGRAPHVRAEYAASSGFSALSESQ